MKTKRKADYKLIEKLITKKLSKLLYNYFEWTGVWSKYCDVEYLDGEYCSPCRVYFYYKLYDVKVKKIWCEIDAYDNDKTILLKAFVSIMRNELKEKLEGEMNNDSTKS